MKALWKKTTSSEELVEIGVFSRKKTAKLVSKGARHVHSSSLGRRDPCYKITQKRLVQKKKLYYPWESQKNLETTTVNSSEERHQFIIQLTAHPKLKAKRELKERLKIVLEEMITNSLYHAYHKISGEEKYRRSQPVSLNRQEEILFVRYQISKHGVYIEVKDHGGPIQFKDIAAALERCYGASENQIDTKESGAGLGLYMIFEAVTHLKIECKKDKETSFSCWISDKYNQSPDTFSFNFFRKE